MATRLTTICCSALALIAASALEGAAQSTPSPARRVKQTHAADDRTPLPLFPLQTLWTLGLNNSLTAPPAFDATRAFFPLEGDQLAAYSLATGARLWVASIRTRTEPAAGDDRIFVVGARVLTALRATDGTSAWELPFAETLSVPPVVDNGWLIAATTAGDVLAFRAADGALIWRRNIGASAHARPALSGDRVYVPTSNARVVALRVDTGAPIWERRLGGAVNDILASDGRLYVGSADKYMYGLNVEDGHVEWRWQTGAAVIGLPVVDEHSVFFVSLDNVLRGVKRSSGVQRWKSPLPLRPTTGPLRAGNTLIVSGPAPTLRAYNTEDGKAAGEFAMGGELAAPPHLFTLAQGSFPIVIAVTRDIIKGAIAVALTRSADPAVVPFLPLPNVIPMNASGSAATPSGGPPTSSPENRERGPLVIPPTPR